jgi:hypothetical protein
MAARYRSTETAIERIFRNTAVGTGFWITQLVLLVAAIGIGISAERQNRRKQDLEEEGAPVVTVPLETAVASFTIVEQQRLMLLRRSVEQSRARKADLYDDLAADMPVRRGLSVAEPALTPALSQGEREARDRDTRWLPVIVWVGVILVAVGGVGMFRTELEMRRLDRESFVSSSVLAHLLPGVIADPGRYLAAVNSGPAGAVSGGRDPLQALAAYDAKQSMDRFEALVGLGLALMLITTDALPLLLLSSAAFASLSFFELP